MDCYSAVSILRARLKKAQAKPSFRPHRQYFSEPAGMRALAFAPKRQVVENGNGRLPGEPQFSLQQPRHDHCCTKRHKYHARIGPRFTGFTRALRATGERSHFSTSLSFWNRVPLWHSLNAMGCKGDLPSGGMALVSKLHSFASLPPLSDHRYASRLVRAIS